MFHMLLPAVVLAGLVHGLLTRNKGLGRVPEMMLVWLLAVYCGLAQIAVGTVMVVNPDWVATHMARVPPGNPVMLWAGFLYLGLAIIATMTVKLRGTFILGPVIAWSIFWIGATYAHVQAEIANGTGVSAHGFAAIFIAHGLVGIILIALTVWWWKARKPVLASQT